jgi:hypothetical protein
MGSAKASGRSEVPIAWLRVPRLPRAMPHDSVGRAWLRGIWRLWQRPASGRGAVRLHASSVLAAAAVLPMEPQPILSHRKQWFEGWFFRFVDHASLTSIAVIFGSLRRQQLAERELAQPFDEHLVVVAYRDASGTDVMESALLDGGSVSLSGGDAAGRPSATWWSTHHGGMRVVGDDAFVDVQLRGGLRVVANVSGPRVPWSGGGRVDHDGPEGWLARTGLLPCHYFVHSFGSAAKYELWPRSPQQYQRGRRAPLAAPLKGRALTHIERNYGDAFPTGWVWGQAAAPAGDAFLILTGGRFIIGPLTTHSYVIGLRATRPPMGPGAADEDGTEGLQWNFRTTDLDRVIEARHPCDGALLLNATSRSGLRRLEVQLRAPPHTFGERIMVPTNAGRFSDVPGCRESYAATAHVSAWARNSRWGDFTLAMQATIPLAVLEFGGDFQCSTSGA